MNFDNLISVCDQCHRVLHGKHASTTIISVEKRRKTTLYAKYSQIANVELLGTEMTYDIFVEGQHHNFVANGFIVHNSGRYVEFEEDEFYVPSVWRKQSTSNKQASDGVIEAADDTELTQDLIAHYAHCHELYRKALSKGVAREMARLYLPGFAVYYTGIWKQDAHNLMHFLKLRMAPDAQEEIRVYAQAIYTHFFKPALPWTAEAFEKYVLNKPEGQ